MPVPCLTTFVNFFCIKESTKEESTKSRFYLWLQFLVGTAGFLGFVSYGSYIVSFYNIPIIIACYFISGVAFVIATLGMIKLLVAYRAPRKNTSSTDDGIEMNVEPRAENAVESNAVPDSAAYVDEVEDLRHMLRLALSELKKTQVPNQKQIRKDQHHATLNFPHPKEDNRTHRFPTMNRLRRTESYESSLKSLHSYSNKKGGCSYLFSSNQGGNFYSSSSDRDTYTYSSSSEGTNPSICGWKMNFKQKPRETTIPTSIAQYKVDFMPNTTEDVTHFMYDKGQFDLNRCPSRITSGLPKEFPALPFPKPSYANERNTHRYMEDPKQFMRGREKALSPVTSMNKSRSMINVDQSEHMSKKEALRILANLSPAVSEVASGKSKRSHKKHGKKHCPHKNHGCVTSVGIF